MTIDVDTVLVKEAGISASVVGFNFPHHIGSLQEEYERKHVKECPATMNCYCVLTSDVLFDFVARYYGAVKSFLSHESSPGQQRSNENSLTLTITKIGSTGDETELKTLKNLVLF